MTDTYKVYRGHNSPYLLEITDVLGNKYNAAKMAAISRMYLKYIPASGATAEFADSEGSGHEDCFDWATYASTGRVLIDIGMLDFTAGRDTAAEVVVYDTDYPNGRVVEQIDVYVSDESDGDINLADALSVISDTSSRPPLTVIDNYTILIADIGKTIRLNATTPKILTLPAGIGAAHDGAKFRLIKIGAGNLVAASAGGKKIYKQSYTQWTGTTEYAVTDLEYIHSIGLWAVCNSMGSWSGA